MKLVLRVLGLLGVIIAGFLVYASTKPDTFQIARSIEIQAPPEKIFPLVNDLKAFNTWNPFYGKDPAAKFAYAGQPAGKGAIHSWEGNSDVGKGSIEITEAVAPGRVAMRLDMVSPMEANNEVAFTMVPEGGTTKITWEMRGAQPFPAKVMDAIFGMDAMVGAEFEKGLQSLKAKAEAK